MSPEKKLPGGSAKSVWTGCILGADGDPAAEATDTKRLRKIQLLGEKLLEALEVRLKDSDSAGWTPQSFKHISGTLKDIKELFMLRPAGDNREQALKLQQLERQLRAAEENAGAVTVRILPEGEELSG